MTRPGVLTGADRGIVLVTALARAGAGSDVIGTVRSEAKADGLRAAAEAANTTIRTVLLDVNDAASTEAGFAQVAELTDGGP